MEYFDRFINENTKIISSQSGNKLVTTSKNSYGTWVTTSTFTDSFCIMVTFYLFYILKNEIVRRYLDEFIIFFPFRNVPLLDLSYHPWSSFWKKSAWWQQQTLMKDQALDIQAQTRLSWLEMDRARAWALPWIPGMGLRRAFKCTKQNTYSDFQALSQNLGSGQPRAWALLQKSGSRPSKRHVPLTDPWFILYKYIVVNTNQIYEGLSEIF